jgi:major membrane immunogen (membrane-anchored lipoprotein)
MKKILAITSIVALAALLAFTGKQAKYKDGVYVGESQSIYTQEPFFGQATVTIKQGQIVDVVFKVIDKVHNEPFDEKYEKHYSGNEEYIQQCRNDWKGVQTYPKTLLKKKDIEKVDAVSGATWSYNLLKASLQEALKKAEIKK